MTAQLGNNELIVRGPIAKPDWETRIGVRSYGRSGNDHHQWKSISTESGDHRVLWNGAVMDVEFLVGTEGIRQNFLVNDRPIGTGNLEIILDINSGLCPEAEGTNGIAFRTADGHLGHAYRDLRVWDACGEVLEASMSLNHGNSRLTITVDDQSATYPIVVDPVSTTEDRLLNPPIGGDFGYSVSTAGDLNGDGYSDVVVGAPQATSGQAGEGLVYVYYGSVTGIPAAPSVTLQVNQAGAQFGFSVDGAGDVNNDGYSDLLVGAPTWEDNAATDKEGAMFVFHGSAAGVATLPAVILQPNATNNYMGYSVSCLGDINGDGYSDVGVGGYLAAYPSFNEGVAWIYLGSAVGVNPVFRHRLERDQAAAQFGGSISAAGDVNGDGFSDVIIGAHKFELTPGCPTINTCDDGGIFIYHGSANALGAGANPAPARIFNTAGYSIHTGWAVSTAGDVNGDGYSDVIVGDWRDEMGPEISEGSAFIFHGSPAGVNIVPATIIQGNQAGAKLGRSVSTAGDVNGDGYADVIIGAQGYTNGQANEGAAFLHLGSASGVSSSAFLRYEGNGINVGMGESVNTAGDVNGDGYSDMIVGVPFQTGGRAKVFLGGTSNVSALPSFTSITGSAGAHLGWSVANAGDVNGDGYSDAIFGAPDGALGQPGEGLAYVHYGSITGLS
ncbi:MAG: FG-GAP repeat protein, partial [Flavobacteriales bacterium]|nr:FG-GAP repeat protein [Flavobacteriales bacterium]